MQRKNDIIGGITTFFTMAYIVIVNPSVLATSGTGMEFSGVLTATVLLAFSMTMLMGLFAKLPIAVAPGMGINAFFTYNLILTQKIAWPIALGMVFWSGLFFLLISLTNWREKIAYAIPNSLRISFSVGIGLFLTFIGLKNLNIIQADAVTILKVAPIDSKILIGVAGLFLATILLIKKNSFAFLISIVGSTIIGYIFGLVKLPDHFFSKPDWHSVLFKLDFWGSLKLSLLPAIFSLMITDLLDSISTFVALAYSNQTLLKNNQPKNLKEGLIVDSLATLFAGLLGTSSGTAYLESAAGIEVGAKTGFASIVTALCFIPCLFIAPLIAVIPDFATAPVLILVGGFMFRTIFELKNLKLEEYIACFLAIVLIPLTFSITQGILWGLISYVVLFSLVGRAREINKTLWILAGLAVLMLFLLQVS